MTQSHLDVGDQPSQSVIYSFFDKWEQPLRAGKVGVFFRKRFPSKKPKNVYFYIGAPVMAVIGRAAVTKIERLSKKDALSLADQGSISRDELDRYIGDRNSVGAIHIDDFEFFAHPVSASAISSVIVFSPPQNFQKISEEEEAVIGGLVNVA